MKRITTTTLALTMFLVALAASAGETKLFAQYENTRQALLDRSLEKVQVAARALAETARAERQNAIAERADALANAANLKGARDSFAMLSEELIRFRDDRSGRRPDVVYCSMEKKSWLQPKGDIPNPYLDASMRSCGYIRKDKVTPPRDMPSHVH